jgi:hypothetical protein
MDVDREVMQAAGEDRGIISHLFSSDDLVPTWDFVR